MTQYKLGLLGYYGFGNYGDELFKVVFEQYIKNVNFVMLEEVTGVMKSFHATPKMRQNFADYVDGILIGGGDLIRPGDNKINHWFPEYLTKPIFVHSIGVARWLGFNKETVEKIRHFFQHNNIKHITVRDVESKQWLEKHIRPKCQVDFAPDIVCTLDLPKINRTQKALGIITRKQIGQPLKEDQMLKTNKLLHKVCSIATNKGFEIRQIILSNGLTAKEEVDGAQCFDFPDKVTMSSQNLNELTTYLGECSMLISSKFHGCVVASMYGIPAIGLGKTNKFVNFYRMIEREELLAGIHDSYLLDLFSPYIASIPTFTRNWLKERAKKGLYNLNNKITTIFASGNVNSGVDASRYHEITGYSKVFIIGWHKTGTSSVYKALTQYLNYKGINKSSLLRSIFIDKTISLEDAIKLVSSYEVTTDFPWTILFKELDKAYPNSKFILTIRDRNTWIDSIINHTEIIRGAKGHKHLYGFIPNGLQTSTENRQAMINRYLEHNESVREYFRDSPRLLEINLSQGDGWDKLCGFLGCEEPGVPFPHANKKKHRENNQDLRKDTSTCVSPDDMNREEIQNIRQQAEANMKLGEYVKAQTILANYIEKNPEDGEALFLLSRALFRLKKTGQAEACLRRAIKIIPNHCQAINLLGLVLSEAGRRQEAEECFLKIMEIQPTSVNPLISLGKLLHRNGRFEEAKRILTQALKISPKAQEIRLNLAINLLYLEEFDDGYEIIEELSQEKKSIISQNLKLSSTILLKALKKKPAWPWAMLQLSRQWRKKQLYSQILDLIQESVTNDSRDNPFHGELFELLCEAVCHTMDKARASSCILEICRKDISKHGKSNSSSLYLGQAYFLLGNFEKAVSHFQEAAQNGCGSRADAGGCRTILGDKFAQKLSQLDFNTVTESLPHVEFDAPHTPSDSDNFVLTFACDDRYFQMFAELYLSSIYCYTKQALCHLHIVNPTGKAYSLAQEMKSTFKSLRINFSYEMTEFEPGFINLKTYYACCRFLRAPLLLDCYNIGILITDCDVVFKADVLKTYNFLRNKDVGLKLRIQKNFFPWRSIPAQYVYFSATDNGKYFACHLAKYIAVLFKSKTDENLWWFDQSALYCTYHHLCEVCPDIKYYNFYENSELANILIMPSPGQSKKEFIDVHGSTLLPKR